jgi:Ni,Fe-hydrogenase maturation factor
VLGNLLPGDDGVELRLLPEDLRRAAGEFTVVAFVDGGTEGPAVLAYLAVRPTSLILDAVDRPPRLDIPPAMWLSWG